MATVQRVNTSEFFDNSLTSEDSTILSSEVVNSLFNTAEDTVELYIYNYSKELEESNPNYTDWKLPNDGVKQGTVETSDIVLDPEQASGAYNTQNNRVYVIYNFVNNKLNSSSENQFFISSINSDRTEIELQNNNILDEVLEQGVFNLQQEIQTSEYFIPLYLNFGEGPKYIAINIRLNKQSTPYKVQLKLYEPLPNTIQVKSECWIQTLIADSNGYEVVYDDVIEVESDLEKLRGPNFNIDIAKRVSNSTEYKSKLELNQTNLTGSRSQLSSLLKEKGVELNIDYTDYSNFVHFSSATQRLENFHYKVSLIEGYQNDINAITGSSAPIAQQSQSISSIQADIDRIITNFDGYDYYLYYESGSKAWPKTNSVKPYTLASTGSAEVITWYGTEGLDGTGQLQSASIYDNGNQDNLVYSTPEFIREDSDNAAYDLFIEMIGQHFDNLYLYTEAITQKYNADNRLDFGVSKDLVADTLRSFGVKLYENNFSTDDLYTALIGLTPSGSTLPLPNISTSFPVTGSGIEYIETIVSASNEVIPLDDLNKSIYKRLYHNLPALVKKKGTLAGLRLLINTYGIPDTILRISEFGGKDKDNSNDWDYWQRKYNLKADLNGTDQAIRAFWSLDSDWNSPDDVPGTVSFRFKAEEVTADTAPTNASQSVWSVADQIGGTTYMNTVLTYTGSAGTSGSYSGSVVDPYYQYATLTFFPDYADTTQSASVYLPFYDGGWWSVMVNRSASIYNIYAKNSIYNGDTGTEIGFQASASLNASTTHWTDTTNRRSFFGNSMDTYSKFSGSVQELRYFTTPLSESVFDDFVMNPNSIEGNSINSSADELAFRATLGGELYTGSLSIHPKSAGDNPTASFGFGLDNTFQITASFSSNTEVQFLDQPAVGIKNRISDKIRLDNNNAYGTVLSNQRSLIQNTPATKKYTRDTNYLEVGFSPQNEINDDIINQIGYFNIGDYIGDPRQISSSLTSYEDLDALRLDYFKKYSKSYDLNDYLRLIKFYDNSLFKMVKDFIPARTGAATGAIIKPTILERNRQRPAQVSWTRPEYSASIQPQSRGYETGSIEVVTGGPAGAVNDWVDINQSWTSSILTPEGLVTSIESSEREFYNGEYSGSVIDVVNGELQDNPLLGEAYRLSTGDLQNLDVTLSSEFTSSVTAAPSYETTGSIPFDSVLHPQSNIEEYYNTSSYEYTPKYEVLTNLTVNITGSIISGSQETGDAYFDIKQNNTVIQTLRYNTTTSDEEESFNLNTTIENLSVNPGDILKIDYRVTNNFPLGTTFIKLNTATSWTVTATNLTAQAAYYNDPTVYAQQYFPGNLERFNDFNAIYNNVYSNRISNKYFDVDYTNDALNPTNFGLIISQSALYAQIQDSNYDSKSAFFEARFGGTKQTTSDFNEGREVIAGAQTSYMAYYQYAGSSLAAKEGSANFKVLYLIDEEGELIQPNADQSSSYFLNTNQAFTQNSEVDIVTFQSTETETEKFIRETATVYKPLNQVQTILYSDTGSLGNDYLVNGFYSDIDFTIPGEIYTRPFELQARLLSEPEYTSGSSPNILQFNFIRVDEANGYNTSTGKYTAQSNSTVQASLITDLKIRNDGPSLVSITASLYQDTTLLDSAEVLLAAGHTTSPSLKPSASILLQEDAEYYIEVEHNQDITLRIDSEFNIRPQLSQSASTPYFLTGSSTTSVLTSSIDLGKAYGGSYKQVPISASGFSDPITFNIEQYDEIRFEGREEKVYLVTNVEQDVNTSTVYITLNEPVNTIETNIQYFAIRRNTVNPNFIMVDSNTVRPAGPGFIVPKYPSRQLKNNFDTIVKDFAEKNLI